MKKGGISTVLYFVVSLLFYIAALFGRLNAGNTSQIVLCICLGSVYLCLGAVRVNRQDKEDKKMIGSRVNQEKRRDISFVKRASKGMQGYP